MILDLKKLKRSGKEHQEFFFNYQPERELIDIPSVEFEGDIKINGSVYLTGEHSAVIEGEVCFALVGECTRCLSRTRQEYVIELSESASGDVIDDGYPVKNDTVDLSKIVDDLVMMNIPTNFLCSEDCKGICAGCGTNLNEGECKCKNK